MTEDKIESPADYITRLEQENKELKETVKDLNQSIQNCNIQRTKMYKALEEIKRIIVINKDEFDHCLYHDYDEQILNKINECL